MLTLNNVTASAPSSTLMAQTPGGVLTAPSPAEIQAARQVLERIYQSSSATGALGGSGSVGSRALGLLAQGLGVALGTAGFWLAMQQPAGLPVLQETLLMQGPEGFFDRLDSMLAGSGGDTGAANALRGTVMGFLADGQVHSAGVVLGETLTQLQERGLISRHADARGLAFDAVLTYAQQHPDTVRPQAPQGATAQRVPPPVAPALSTAQQTPALASEIHALRAGIAEGRFANSEEGFAHGQTQLEALVAQANELRAQGVQTFGADAVQAAQVELVARRHHSVISQYLRNAEEGGALPSTADVRTYLDGVRGFDGEVAAAYGRPAFGDAALANAEGRLTAATEARAAFVSFVSQVGSGAYANSADTYAAGVERLEAFRQQANTLAGTEGVLALTSSEYIGAALQLEGRRLNSVLAQTFRDAEAGRPVDPDAAAAAAMLDRAGQLDAEASRTTGSPLFAPGALATYREALTRLASPQAAAAGEPGSPDPRLPSIPEPTRLPGGDDVQRVAEEYGVSAHDVVRVMQDNPGMSPEHAAQYIRGALLAAPTGLDAPRMPPPPPGGGDGEGNTAAASDPDGTARTGAAQLPPDGTRTLNVLQPDDLGFRTSTDGSGTHIVFLEFIGPRAGYDHARWDAMGYRVHDSYTPETGWTTYVSDARSGEVLGYAANTRLASVADRLGEVIEHNASQLEDPGKRDAYIKKWRTALGVLLNPGATRAAPNEIQNNVRRLGEALQAETNRMHREGAGEQIILPTPENRTPDGFEFHLPGPTPRIGD